MAKPNRLTAAQRFALCRHGAGAALAPGRLSHQGRRTARRLTRPRAEGEIVIMPDATRLFEEPSALDQVVERAKRGFLVHVV